MSFNCHDVSKYYGFTIETKNSKYYITGKGRVFGDSKYFKANKRMLNAKVDYIGSISRDDDLCIFSNTKTDPEYWSLTIKTLKPLKKGDMMVLGLKPDGASEATQMQTSSIIDFYKTTEKVSLSDFL